VCGQTEIFATALRDGGEEGLRGGGIGDKDSRCRGGKFRLAENGGLWGSQLKESGGFREEESGGGGVVLNDNAGRGRLEKATELSGGKGDREPTPKEMSQKTNEESGGDSGRVLVTNMATRTADIG